MTSPSKDDLARIVERDAECPFCEGQPMSPDCGICGGAGTLPILDLEALRAALDEEKPLPKPKRIDWSNVVVDEGDEAP